MKTAVDYYPEHWPQERWHRDAKMMRDAGISAVRVGEFAWSVLEPQEGRFEPQLLIDAIKLLGEFDIDVIVGTPTPTYPPWLHRKFPDIHIVRPDGRVVEYGQRQDACKNHTGYRDAAVSITERFSEALADSRNVVAWQIDNELGCHDTARCYCDRCESAFQHWLHRKYQGDVGALNAAWGTRVWSQVYNDFDEVSVPRVSAEELPNGGAQNPGLVLDFFRFSSEVQVDFQKDLIDAVRRHSNRPVTHNLMGGYSKINYFDLARDLDFVSWDNYPFMSAHGSPGRHPSFAHDLMRGLKNQKTWVMEQAAGPGGWNYIRPEVEPGRMRLWAFQAVARGSELVSFFRWRTARHGTEQFWHGILHHHGEPGRRLRELRDFSSELRELTSTFDDYDVVHDVALVFDFETLWSYEIQPMVASGFDYRSFATDIVAQLAALGLTTTVISPEADIPDVPLLIAPSFRLSAECHIAKLEAYVRSGGTLLLGPRSGARDASNAIVDARLPGVLSELAGITISEYDVFSGIPGFQMQLENNQGANYTAYGLAELIEAKEDGDVRLRYRGRYYKGVAAATQHRHEEGFCHYLGTVLRSEDLRAYLQDVCRSAGLETEVLPETVERVRTKTKVGDVTFYLNHGDTPVTVAAEGGFTLDAFGVAVRLNDQDLIKRS